MAERRSTQISVIVTPAIKRAIIALARQDDQSVSTYVMGVLEWHLAGRKVPLPFPPKKPYRIITRR